jgi:hypothetical protein
LDDEAFVETWDLDLNCTMARTQLRISFTPKFVNLQQIILVVSCAPSLDHCYIFEIATQHMLEDFSRYSITGPEASRRWWKLSWTKNPDGVAKQISDKLAETVQQQLESAEKRLSHDTAAAAE